MARKYSGPLRPGEKSAIVPRSITKKDYEVSGVNVLFTQDDLEHLLNLIYSSL